MSICAQCLLVGACIPSPHFSLLIYIFPEDRIKIEGEENSPRGQKGREKREPVGKLGGKGWSLDVSPQHLFPWPWQCWGRAEVWPVSWGSARLPWEGAKWECGEVSMVWERISAPPAPPKAAWGDPELGRAAPGQRFLLLEGWGGCQCLVHLQGGVRAPGEGLAMAFLFGSCCSSCWDFFFHFLSWKMVKDSTEAALEPGGEITWSTG